MQGKMQRVILVVLLGYSCSAAAEYPVKCNMGNILSPPTCDNRQYDCRRMDDMSDPNCKVCICPADKVQGNDGQCITPNINSDIPPRVVSVDAKCNASAQSEGTEVCARSSTCETSGGTSYCKCPIPGQVTDSIARNCYTYGTSCNADGCVHAELMCNTSNSRCDCKTGYEYYAGACYPKRYVLTCEPGIAYTCPTVNGVQLVCLASNSTCACPSGWKFHQNVGVAVGICVKESTTTGVGIGGLCDVNSPCADEHPCVPCGGGQWRCANIAQDGNRMVPFFSVSSLLGLSMLCFVLSIQE